MQFALFLGIFQIWNSVQDTESLNVKTTEASNLLKSNLDEKLKQCDTEISTLKNELNAKSQTHKLLIDEKEHQLQALQALNNELQSEMKRNDRKRADHQSKQTADSLQNVNKQMKTELGLMKNEVLEYQNKIASDFLELSNKFEALTRAYGVQVSAIQCTQCGQIALKIVIFLCLALINLKSWKINTVMSITHLIFYEFFA